MANLIFIPIFDNKKVWITGGEYRSGGIKHHNSSEYILANGTSIPGPDLPVQITLHKMVNINSTHTMIIGGRTYRSINDTNDESIR